MIKPDHELDEGSLAGLTTHSFGRGARFFETVDSTMDIAEEMAKDGCGEGTIVVATQQIEGKGRLGRTFHSPRGGLYLSAVMRPPIPPSDTGPMPLITGLAVSKAVQCTCGVSAMLKWPNDVLVNGSKVSGVLTRSSVRGEITDHIIVGIGINVNGDLRELPEDVREYATTLSQQSGARVDKAELLRNLLYSLEMVYDRFMNGGLQELLDEWSERSSTIGSEVRISSGEEVLEGRALGIDQTGALMISTDGGMVRTEIGDCTHI